MTRRAFAALSGGALAHAQMPRPNILWITCEDMGPHLRACGDTYSVTPNLDKLASRGSIYMNAWSNAPVCAPARTAIISGLYPTSTGSEHMRSITRLPAAFKMFPCYLREAGYYCSNNVKEDYNLEKTPGTWDDSSNKAHWRQRAGSQNFFSVFNLTITHESQLRTRPHTWVHDPANVRVPAYHPDTPEVRQDWAQYYDNITTMDGQAGRILEELRSDGLAEDTIVFFFGDHGSGMPRNKRWPINAGLNVSILAYVPNKFRHLAPSDYGPGGKNSRLVSFVDLAPTMLSLAGIRPPAYYQGSAFMGRHEAPARRYSFGLRGRMDERIDCVRSVRDQRYVYVRNYMPHKIYGQHLAYMWETPTTRVWEQLYKEGKLNAVQRRFWEPKPAEELYDLQTDPDEVNNLASSRAHRSHLERLRKVHQEHTLAIRDVGLLPEADMHARASTDAPYDMGHDPRRYPAERVFAAAGQTLRKIDDPDPAVRYWTALGILMRGEKMPEALLKDPSPSVRIVAAEALADTGTLLSLADASKHGAYVAVQALNAIDALGDRAASIKAQVKALPKTDPNAPERVRSEYTTRLINWIGR
jgi:uncharacterized sulfatase